MNFDPISLFVCGSAIALLLVRLAIQRSSPVVAMVSRWLWWVGASCLTAYCLTQFDVVDRPFWVVALVAFLVWFLVETAFVWFAIHALSESEVPLFPRFSLNVSGDEWPTQPRFLRMRDEMRTAGFRALQALRAEPVPGLSLRVSVYQNAEATVRLQITFLPQPGGAIGTSVAFSSLTEDGRRIVTDNMHLPFGGFYPENWAVERNPRVRSWKGLHARHEARLREAGALVRWEIEPAVDINAQQHELDRVNTELGFLLPAHQREELGRMSHEGRYRVWKEDWLLKYLGRSARYE